MGYIEDMFGMKDRVAVVTGAGGAIAGVIAEAYLRAGAKVALWLHGEEGLAAVRERFLPFASRPDSVFALACDTGDRGRVEAAYEETAAALGKPDVLVNGVGGNRGKTSFVEADLGVFEEVLALNLLAGLVVPMQVFAARWTAAGLRGRSVINMASMGSYVPLSGVWAYNAAKSAVLNLTGRLRERVRPGGYQGQRHSAGLLSRQAELLPSHSRPRDGRAHATRQGCGGPNPLRALRRAGGTLRRRALSRQRGGIRLRHRDFDARGRRISHRQHLR